MKKVMICGVMGRMGQELVKCANAKGFQVVCGVDVVAGNTKEFPIYDCFDAVVEEVDVIIDFSNPQGLEDVLAYATQKHYPLLLAATGYSEAQQAKIRCASAEIPIFQSANLSIGVLVLKQLAIQAKKLLGEYDIEIIEKHHSNKVDAPSGTALMLLNAIKEDDTDVLYGRDPQTGKRKNGEIAVHAVRGGSVSGDHEVLFFGDNEVVSLSHHAQSRSIFAVGAYACSSFLLKQENGLYGMEDLLN